jgi:glycosyltransferase involved in cell wall biosynthesis
VVHNGFANFLYKKDLDESKVEEVLVRNGIKKPYILYIGKLENKKNTPLLIEAFAKVRYLNKNIKEKLVLAGNASFGYDEVKYIINEYHLEEDVSILGWLNEINLAYIVHAATAFIFPSRQEGFGIPILQAMNSCVPLVISDIPVFHEIADGAALFFNPARKEDLAEAIEKIITDEPLRQALIEKGLERAKDFSWEKCARETLQEILSA